MQILGLLLPVFGLIAFAAFVWLLVVAFRQSALWGVLVFLLSPISAVLFAVKYWDEARKPFLAYAGSIAGCIVLAVIMIGFVGAPMVQMAAQMNEGEVGQDEAVEVMEETMDRMETTGMLDAEDKAELGEMRGVLDPMKEDAQETDPAEGVKVALLETESDPESALTARSNRPGDKVSIREIENFVGERLRVVTEDGVEFVGAYIGRSGDELEFAKNLSAGTFAVHYRPDDLRSLHLVKTR